MEMRIVGEGRQTDRRLAPAWEWPGSSAMSHPSLSVHGVEGESC